MFSQIDLVTRENHMPGAARQLTPLGFNNSKFTTVNCCLHIIQQHNSNNKIMSIYNKIS